ncbi:hypothetical protein PPTG_20150 [Phytophthora nicotianae INRA-310]|uniref:Uncharacterized protein n=1 Tax=Phytophthora nicotianae (strain INRA-310) TaxID=761204 RepID=W2P9N0_PHYN3|nr:hypothetical protein PPTG_20150 [Phytophthora nicotianae INRA-310]ETM97747.1 hypothetical protein PPTG_20150 [Phytophthora nicotianae INRA-310]
MARTHKTAHIKAAMAEKERLAKESRRDDIARVQDAHDGKEKSPPKILRRSDLVTRKRRRTKTRMSRNQPVWRPRNGSDSADVSEEDVAQTPVAEEPSGRQRQGKGPF